MSLYDGKTLEADYRQLVRDNLAKLEAERIARENTRRNANGYFQVIDGVCRFVQTLPDGKVSRTSNRSRDRQYRQNLASAKAFEAKREDRDWRKVYG